MAAPLCTFSEPLAEPPPFYKLATDQVGWRASRVACGGQARHTGACAGRADVPTRPRTRLPVPTLPPAQVLCWRDVTFSRHDWQLPRCAMPHPDPTERCAVFGAALLEGKVLPSFAGREGAQGVRGTGAASGRLCWATRNYSRASSSASLLLSLTGLRAGLAVPPSMLLRPEMRVHKRASDLLAALGAACVDSRAALAAKWAQAPGFLRHELAQCMQKGFAGVLLQAWEALQAEAAAKAPPTAAAGGKKKKSKK